MTINFYKKQFVYYLINEWHLKTNTTSNFYKLTLESVKLLFTQNYI